MAGKLTGVGHRLYIGGYILSSDVGVLDKAGGGPAELDVTGLDATAPERIGGLLAGEIDFSCFYSAAAGRLAAVLSLLPTTDQVALYGMGNVIGNPAAGVSGKQINYDWNRAGKASLTGKIQIKASHLPLEWGEQMIAEAAPASPPVSGVLDLGASGLPAPLNIVSTSTDAAAVITTLAHGLVTGDSVQIAGATITALNAKWTVTVLSPTTFTVPHSGGAGGAAVGTVQQTSSDLGASAYLEVAALASGTLNVQIQHSPDNVTFANITGLAFAPVTVAPTAQRIATASAVPIQEYTTAHIGTGSPTGCVLVLSLCRFPVLV